MTFTLSYQRLGAKPVYSQQRDSTLFVSLPLAIHTSGAWSVIRMIFLPRRYYLTVSSAHFTARHSFSTIEYFYSLSRSFLLIGVLPAFLLLRQDGPYPCVGRVCVDQQVF